MKRLPIQYQTTTPISWDALYFAAESHNEPFQDVNVITLKSHFVDKVYEEAIREVGLLDEQLLTKKVAKVIASQEIKVQEHVEVSPRGIKVIINRNIIDDKATWDALDHVAVALERLDGKTGIVPFSEYFSFTAADITWLHKH